MTRRFAMVLLVAALTSSVTARAGNGHTGDAVEHTGSGDINWTVGEVSATGIGAPPALAANAAQARAMAERAAFVVALRNLLETVKGVRVDSESVVENFMVKSDTIRTRVDGIVKGARTVKTSFLSDGSVEVRVALPLTGALMNALVPEDFGRPALMPAVPGPAGKSKPEPRKSFPASPRVPEKKPEQPKPSGPSVVTAPEKRTDPGHQKKEPLNPPSPPAEESTTRFKGGNATGLVIDGRGLGLRPALLPKILDAEGREIYVGQVVPRTNAVEQGVAGYAKDVNAAVNNFRVTDNPAVLQGLRASGAARTDIVVGQADAQELRELGSRSDFLQYCRVIIVY